MGQDRQMLMVRGNGGNQLRQYAGQMAGNQNGYNVVQNVRNQVIQNAVWNPNIQNVRNQNGLIVVPRIANPNTNQNGNGNVVATRAKGNGNGNNENQGTQTNKAPGYDSDGSAEVNLDVLIMEKIEVVRLEDVVV
uniref:Reverse transcriptase domain-containing protein n=1 Tax=Tanacetum cinerariifolium TaxID=118510 RepID=A0A6L2J999_TANCI|nr:hypothetical protein [Tanacetum cinerariifolium]